MKRVLIIVENLSVPFDRRVWQESLALTDAGFEVHVICPTGSPDDEEPEVELEGVHIHRYPLTAAERGGAGYAREYAQALWRSWRLARRLGRFDVVHLCNPPDLLFLLALPFKLSGARVVFDQHDLVPELYLSRFEQGEDFVYRVLRGLERLTYRVADVVLATNESYAAVARERGGVPANRVFVVRSAPDTGRFRRLNADPRLKKGKPHLIHYHGVMGPQDGVDFALHALEALAARRPEDDWHATFAGTGDVRENMIELASELGLASRVSFPGRISDELLLHSLATASVGLAPDPKNPLNDVSTMNKILEYMASGLPLVSFDLREARASAGEAALYAPANDHEKFAALIDHLLDSPDERRRRGELGRERVNGDLSWRRSVKNLVAGYSHALGGAPIEVGRNSREGKRTPHPPGKRFRPGVEPAKSTMRALRSTK